MGPYTRRFPSTGVRGLGVALLLALFLAPAATLAGGAAASKSRAAKVKSLQQQAVKHFKAREYDRVVALFGQAFALDGRPKHLLNVALAQNAGGRCAEAVASFSRYLKLCETRPCPQRTRGEKRFARAKAKCTPKAVAQTRLKIETTPPGAEITIGKQRRKQLSPLTVRLAAGRYRIQARIDGRKPVSRYVRVGTSGEQVVHILVDPEATQGWMIFTNVPRGARVSLDGRSVSTARNRAHAVKPGLHRIRVSPPGYPSWIVKRRVSLRETLELDLSKRPVRAPPPEPATPWDWRGWTGIGLVAFAVVTGGVAAWTLSERDDSREAYLRAPANRDERDRFETMHYTGVSLGVLAGLSAVAGAGALGWQWYDLETGPDATGTVRPVVEVDATGRSAVGVFGVRFGF